MGPVSEDASIEHYIYQMLTKTFILLDDSNSHFFAEYGLSTRQFWALQHLDEQNGRSMVDLSRLLLTDKSNVTGIIDRLENLHLVKRATSVVDRRVNLITLTAEGRRLRDTIDQQHERRIRELMSVLDQAQLHTLLEHLHVISKNIEASLELADTASSNK